MRGSEPPQTYGWKIFLISCKILVSKYLDPFFLEPPFQISWILQICSIKSPQGKVRYIQNTSNHLPHLVQKSTKAYHVFGL